MNGSAPAIQLDFLLRVEFTASFGNAQILFPGHAGHLAIALDFAQYVADSIRSESSSHQVWAPFTHLLKEMCNEKLGLVVQAVIYVISLQREIARNFLGRRMGQHDAERFAARAADIDNAMKRAGVLPIGADQYISQFEIACSFSLAWDFYWPIPGLLVIHHKPFVIPGGSLDVISWRSKRAVSSAIVRARLSLIQPV